jgi:hypothetical protein
LIDQANRLAPAEPLTKLINRSEIFPLSPENYDRGRPAALWCGYQRQRRAAVSPTSRLFATWVADEQRWLHEVVSEVDHSQRAGLIDLISFLTLVTVSAAAWLSVLGIVIKYVI